MRIKLPESDGFKSIAIKSEYIRLDSLLKLANITCTGGEAKLIIQDSGISVNGEICTQRGRKLRPGDIVRYSSQILRIIRTQK